MVVGIGLMLVEVFAGCDGKAMARVNFWRLFAGRRQATWISVTSLVPPAHSVFLSEAAAQTASTDHLH
jgi:hypothetical protein